MPVPTFGVEEEFFLADETDGSPREDAEAILADARARADESMDHELRSAMVETGTAVCADTESLQRQLVSSRRTLVEAAASRQARALATGTHPTARAQRVGYGDDERYRRMAEVFAQLADEALVCGCHVHVQVPDRERGVHVIDRIGGWLPVLLAIAANSPFWEGNDSRFDSWRARVWSRWPTAGPTSPFGTHAGYEKRAEALIQAGAALDRGMLYYDARLAERYPTVEIRVADVCLDVMDAVLVAALARALVVTAIDDRVSAPSVPVELKRAAGFAAARWGLGAQLFDPRTLRPAPAPDVVAGLIDEVRDALDEAGDTGLATEGVQRVLRRGNGATQQRAAWHRGGASGVLDAVTLRHRA
jgi:carboxylate-amine ligase